MDKITKISITVAALITSLSIAYYFIARPMLNEKKLTNCLQEANKTLNVAREKASEVRKGNNEENATAGLKKIGNIYEGTTEQERKYLDQKAAFEEIQKRAEKAEKECFMKYPQK